jgi:hypothetical protein
MSRHRDGPGDLSRSNSDSPTISSQMHAAQGGRGRTLTYGRKLSG